MVEENDDDNSAKTYHFEPLDLRFSTALDLADLPSSDWK